MVIKEKICKLFYLLLFYQVWLFIVVIDNNKYSLGYSVEDFELMINLEDYEDFLPPFIWVLRDI